MKTQSVETDALARAAAGREADLADLFEELRIPSVSTLPERREDCLRNARCGFATASSGSASRPRSST